MLVVFKSVYGPDIAINPAHVVLVTLTSHADHPGGVCVLELDIPSNRSRSGDVEPACRDIEVIGSFERVVRQLNDGVSPLRVAPDRPVEVKA
jgi:hypothetical protein